MDNNDNFYDSLVWNEKFRKWVLSPDAELNSYWLSWLAANPGKQEAVKSAKEIILSLAIKEPEISDETITKNIDAILFAVKEREIEEVKREPSILKSLWSNGLLCYGIVASFLVASIVSVFFIVQRKPAGKETVYNELVNARAGDKLVEIANNKGTRDTVLLPDGSTIILEDKTKISYSSNFNEQLSRKVYLSGDAIFEVTKNPARPFIVYSNDLITKVLGTKFFVHAKDGNKKPFVEVISGIVSVSSFTGKNIVTIDSDDIPDSRELNTIVITANQKANYSSIYNTLVAGIVENPVVIPSHETNFRFKDTPIDTVFKAIENAYGIDIVYDEKILAHRTFTAVLTTETMYEKIDIIAKALNARYELIGGKIVLYKNASY